MAVLRLQGVAVAALLCGLIVSAPALAKAEEEDDAPADDGDAEGLDYGDFGGEDEFGDDYGDYGGTGGELEGHISGVLDLDDATFDKVIDGRHHALVVFYDPYGEGLTELSEEFKGFATELKDASNVVLAKVDGTDAEMIKERFGVSSTPALLFFAKGTTEPATYDGDVTKDALVEYVAGHAGGPGTVEALEPAVKAFVGAKDLKAALPALDAAVAAQSSADAAYYAKAASKAAEKGAGWFATELDRLGRMVSGGALREEKQTEFKRRLWVLKVFLGAQGSGSAKHSEL